MNKLILCAFLAFLAACSGNPLNNEPDDGGGGGGGGGGVGGDGTLPPGTTDPTAARALFRYEEQGDEGGGEAQSVAYDAATDTISVDNLPFDGTGVYDRDNQVRTLNGFAVYENNNPDPHRAYKAIFGVGRNEQTRVAVIRTGDYQGLGFGGFVYERDLGVDLPTSGDAVYTGNYAGLRIYDGRGGLDYTRADAVIEVDFEDFNATDAVEGRLTGRRAFDQAGNLLETLPTLIFATGSITAAGEITGTAGSTRVNEQGALEEFETGNYYAVLSGADAGEIVGVVVVEGDAPNEDGITFQETGAFLVDRTP